MAELKPCPFCGSDDVGVGYEYPEFGEELRYFGLGFPNESGNDFCSYGEKED